MNAEEKRTKIYQVILKNIVKLMKMNGIKSNIKSKNDDFVNDIGFDSLDIAEILVDIEMAFNIEIPENLIQDTSINTINDVICIVDSLTEDDLIVFDPKENCHLKENGRCCCNCNNRWQDFYSTGHKEKEQRGWACVLKDSKKVYSQLAEHGICDKFSRNKNL
jgi:acyl carrier protein